MRRPFIAWGPRRGNRLAIKRQRPTATTPASAERRRAPRAAEGLDTPLQFLKGVGPQRAKLLAKLGLETVADALLHLPRRHEDRSQLTPLGRLAVGPEPRTCAGTVARHEPAAARPAPGAAVRRRCGIPPASCAPSGSASPTSRGSSSAASASSSMARSSLPTGERRPRDARGRLRDRGGCRGRDAAHGPPRPRLSAHRRTAAAAPPRLAQAASWTRMRRQCPSSCPPRSSRAGGSCRSARRCARDTSPPPRRSGRRAAVASSSTISSSSRWGWPSDATARGARPGLALNPPGELARRLRAALPFALTGAQERVWKEIRTDMAAPYPMNRLLQGDVGSGKTIVACLAILTAIEAGYQAALMAPTEILAEQHCDDAGARCSPRWGWRSRSSPMPRAGRPAASGSRRCAAGAVGCVVGTHALVQKSVGFKRLGLAVVDEQHRFGVVQRAVLRGKGESPDVLVMTATPIPADPRPHPLRRPRRLRAGRDAAGAPAHRHRRPRREGARQGLRASCARRCRRAVRSTSSTRSSRSRRSSTFAPPPTWRGACSARSFRSSAWDCSTAA